MRARPQRISWARLLERVFEIDMQHCPRCGAGDVKIIAAILERAVIEKILRHLGLDPQPRPGAGRASRCRTDAIRAPSGPRRPSSLHPQEIHFNDIRTTLQALIATYDNANSLHTNAYDEAIATPTEESVRRAMETCYPRGRIQDESMHYEHLKHTGEYPVIGVNTFRNPHGDPIPQALELARSTEGEKRSQLARLADFHARNAQAAPAMLRRLQDTVIADGNVFEVLMDAVRVCSLGQHTNALFEVGGQYRRNM